jgi:hypothetical protein
VKRLPCAARRHLGCNGHHLDAGQAALDLLGVGQHVLVLPLIDLELLVGLLVGDQIENFALDWISTIITLEASS